MVRWFHLLDQQYIGFWSVGVVMFLLQELPYLVMPLLRLRSNPIMTLKETSPVLNGIEKITGVLCIIVMCFVVQENAALFTPGNELSKVGLVAASIILLANYVGWIWYFSGFQAKWMMLTFLVALPPLYYAAIGLWRGNWMLLGLSFVFALVHMTHVAGNLRA